MRVKRRMGEVREKQGTTYDLIFAGRNYRAMATIVFGGELFKHCTYIGLDSLHPKENQFFLETVDKRIFELIKEKSVGVRKVSV